MEKLAEILGFDIQSRYICDFKNGMKNGKGIEETPDGIRFEGSYLNDQKDGAFVEKDQNGNVIRKGIYNRGRLMGE